MYVYISNTHIYQQSLLVAPSTRRTACIASCCTLKKITAPGSATPSASNQPPPPPMTSSPPFPPPSVRPLALFVLIEFVVGGDARQQCCKKSREPSTHTNSLCGMHTNTYMHQRTKTCMRVGA